MSQTPYHSKCYMSSLVSFLKQWSRGLALKRHYARIRVRLGLQGLSRSHVMSELESQLESHLAPPATLPKITPSNYTLWRVGMGKVAADHSFYRAKSQPGPLESQKKSQVWRVGTSTLPACVTVRL